MGRNSGVRPTASATAKSSDSRTRDAGARRREARKKNEEEHRAHDEERELSGAALELRLGRAHRQARGNVAERRSPGPSRRPVPSPYRLRPTCRGRRRCGHPPAGAGRPRGRPRPSRPASTRPSVRLLDVEVARLEEARVGRDAIPAASRTMSPGTARAVESRSRFPSRRAVAGRRHGVAQSLGDSMER